MKRDKLGRFVSNKNSKSNSKKSQKKVTKKVKRPTVVQKDKVNYIALVVDDSGSMSHLRDQTVKSFNDQILNIKKNAADMKQGSYVSFIVFSDYPEIRVKNQWHEATRLISRADLNKGGNTALRDAISHAIDQLKTIQVPSDVDPSYLVITLTDGEENISRNISQADLAKKIQECQATDRWTFAACVPPTGGAKTLVEQLGVPSGNITVWEATVQGMQNVARMSQSAVSSYYQARSVGQRSTKSFFTDLSKVTQKDLNKLTESTDDFKVWTVDKEQDITTFVNNKLTSPTLQAQLGHTYTPGKGFYELTKPETVQSYKELAIMDKLTSKIYSGQEARKLLGLPLGQDIKLKPLDHGKFHIFVSSTSTNRKLIGHTKFLYRKN